MAHVFRFFLPPGGAVAVGERVQLSRDDAHRVHTVLRLEAGEAIEIAFYVRYLLDGLKAMAAEEVELRCNGPTTPAVLVPLGEDGAFTYLVMPVQIRS